MNPTGVPKAREKKMAQTKKGSQNPDSYVI